MDTNKLRYFYAVYRAGSLARASEIIHITPAALSKTIKMLEEEVGVKLILPDGRGIKFTEYAHLLGERSGKILEDIDLLKQTLSQNTQTQAAIRIGSIENFTSYFLGKFASQLDKTQKLIVHELLPGDIEMSLLNNQIDLGITPVPQMHQELEHIKIGEAEMGIFANNLKFDDYEFSDLPFVVPTELLHNIQTKESGLDGWRTDFGPRLIVYQTALCESALELCRQGLAVAYFPKFMIKLHNAVTKNSYRLTELRCSPTYLSTQTTYLVVHKGRVQIPIIEEIKRCWDALL